MPYIDLNAEKATVRTLTKALGKYKLSARTVRKALRAGFERMRAFHADIVAKADKIIYRANRDDVPIVVLAGRPYHIDPEINHGINKLLVSLGFAVLTEDSVFERAADVKLNVLNQWTYHARLYRAAEYVSRNPNMNLVQLVSFGCGIDAVTTDEVNAIMTSRGRLYTQLKIDEINNLGVVKIRLRSMLAAIQEQNSRKEHEGNYATD